MPTNTREKTVQDFDDQFRRQLVDLFSLRRDVREFKKDALPAGTIERLIEIACLAPSVGLSEPWRFVMVKDTDRRERIRESFTQVNAVALQQQAPDRSDHYARLKLAGFDAPEHVAVFADRPTTQGHGLGRRTMPETVEYSAVMAIHTLWLAARAEGIGMGWVSIIDPYRVTEILDVPSTWTFLGYLCLGHPIEVSRTPALERDGWEYRRAASTVTIMR